MRRILYISHTARLGGAERSLLTLLERLDRGRYEPSVVLPGPGQLADELRRIGIPQHTVPVLGRLRWTRNPLTLFAYFWRWRCAGAAIGRLIEKLGIDLVHANSTTAHLFVSSSPAAARRRIPCIWHVRDTRTPGGRLDAMMTRRAAAIIAVSRSVAERQPGNVAAKTVVIYNGVDTDAFAPADGAALRAEFGLDTGAPVAGIAGQFVPWKGHERFLDAAARVARRLPNACFLVVGDDRFGDFPSALNDLRRKASDLGIDGRVIFTGWRDDMPALLNAMDVLVVASENEPFGRVIIEAMACGKPLIAFRSGGPAEIIEHEKTGLLVEPFDVAAMADAVARLLSDRTEAAAFGQRGREVACERFSAEAHAREVQNLYARLLGEEA